MSRSKSIRRLVVLSWAIMMGAAIDSMAGLQEGINAYNIGNYKQAKALLEPYAAQGNADAQYFLARAYYDDHPSIGWLVAKWFGKAADQGHREALSWYGYCYETGKGLRRDYAKAKHYYEAAAQLNNPSAFYRLGLMYENGRGVEKNDKQAIALYERAASLGHKTAQEQLRSLLGSRPNQEVVTFSNPSDSRVPGANRPPSADDIADAYITEYLQPNMKVIGTRTLAVRGTNAAITISDVTVRSCSKQGKGYQCAYTITKETQLDSGTQLFADLFRLAPPTKRTTSASDVFVLTADGWHSPSIARRIEDRAREKADSSAKQQEDIWQKNLKEYQQTVDDIATDIWMK